MGRGCLGVGGGGVWGVGCGWWWVVDNGWCVVGGGCMVLVTIPNNACGTNVQSI